MTALRPIDELAPADLERWRALADTAIEPNAFFDPDFVTAGARHLDDAAAGVVVVESGSQWVAAVPVSRDRWRRMLPALGAWRGLYGFLATPLVAPGHEDAIPALLRAMSEVARKRAVVITGATVGTLLGPDPPALAGDHPLADRAESERAFLRRRPTPEAYLDHMRSHHRREFNRLGRRLAEEIGAEVSCVDRSRDEEAINAFLQLERSGWKGRESTALASSERDASFFAETCARFRHRARLQLLELRAGDRTVAMKCNLVSPPGSFAFKIAFDEEFARFSPGVQLEIASIDAFHASGLDWMDSCADPDNAMINRLWPDRRPLQSLVYRRPGPIGAAMMGGAELALTAARRFK